MVLLATVCEQQSEPLPAADDSRPSFQLRPSPESPPFNLVTVPHGEPFR